MSKKNEFVIACRLTGLLDKPINQGESFVIANGKKIIFTVHDVIDIGGSRKCIFILTKETRQLYICFSWYNPKGIVDMLYGADMLSKQEIQDGFNAAFYESAIEYLNHTRFYPLFLNLTKESNEVILAGFSMGGSTAACLSYILCEKQNYIGEITVYAMGCPRIGNKNFDNWFTKRLTKKSSCLIAAYQYGDSLAYDPVTVCPSSEEGFAIVPRLYILDIKKGILRKANLQDYEQMVSQEKTCCPPKRSKNIFSKFGSLISRNFGVDYDRHYDVLHSLLKYYQGLALVDD